MQNYVTNSIWGQAWIITQNRSHAYWRESHLKYFRHYYVIPLCNISGLLESELRIKSRSYMNCFPRKMEYAIYCFSRNRRTTDAGFVCTSPRWKRRTEIFGMELRISGVRVQSSLSIGERFHAPLRKIYSKIIFDFEKISRDMVLN